MKPRFAVGELLQHPRTGTGPDSRSLLLDLQIEKHAGLQYEEKVERCESIRGALRAV
jgi:hypothetical protein